MNGDELLFKTLGGYRRAQAVSLMARLGLADALAAGPATVPDIASIAGCDTRALRRLLRVLAAEGLVEPAGPDGYALTPLGAHLRSDSTGRSRRWAALAGEEQYRAWAGALHTLRTGESGFAREHGRDMWAYLAERPDRAALFQAAMAGSVPDFGKRLAGAYPFGARATVVDVGGGSGAVLSDLLDEYPHLECTLLDASPREDPRWTTRAGSFFDPLPGGADVYLLCRVLSDWDDPRARAILRRCRDAMRDDSALLIVGRAADLDITPMLDLHLLVMTGGGDRSPAEYATLLDAAGLRLSGSTALDGTDLILIHASR